MTGLAGSPEAGGYFHRISGASTDGLSVWAAPPIEKTLKTNMVPVASAPLRIQAAKERSADVEQHNPQMLSSHRQVVGHPAQFGALYR